MRPLVLLSLAAALAAPAAAQDAEPPAGPDEGPGLIEEGAGMLLRGLLDEVQPAIDEIAGISADVLPTFRLLAREMGPAFVEVIGAVDSIANYEPPVILPSGDIILRRRDDAPAWTPPEPKPAPEVEL